MRLKPSCYPSDKLAEAASNTFIGSISCVTPAKAGCKTPFDS
jgi:hypothetical protein